MTIPVYVSYTTTGKSRNKERNVVGVICPTAIIQFISPNKYKPIYVDMGNISANWNETTAGFKLITEFEYL